MTTQAESIAANLRELIIMGTFVAGERLQESALASRLKTSRTPVRLALTELANEGLLEYRSNKGFIVKGFSGAEILQAIEIREVLEGMAARQAATLGVGAEVQKKLQASLLQVDGLLAKANLELSDLRLYAEINGDFHAAILEAAQNDMLFDLVRKFDSIPLAGARSFVTLPSQDMHDMRQIIVENQQQHRWIYNAIQSRDAARAETLLRQHINDAHHTIAKVIEAVQESDIVEPRESLLRLVN